MNSIIKHLILIIILIAVYFATDFLEKGIILNGITPYPIIGIIFWLLLLYVVWEVLVRPLLQFRKLRTKHQPNVISQAQKIYKQLDPYKLKNRQESWQSEIWHQLNEILPTKNKTTKENLLQYEKQIIPIIDNYIKHYNNETNKSSDAKKIINQYSWSAALCVVFSRNSFLDGILILIAQMKMTVELSKLYGYKPSPLFNTLCFGWIATNSILTGLFAQAGSEAVGEIITDSLTNGDIIEGGLTNSVISKTSSIALEGLTAATTIYVTGHVVLMKLQGTPQIDIKTLFRLRKQGRWELVKSIPQNTFQALSTKIPNFSQWWESVKKAVAIN